MKLTKMMSCVLITSKRRAGRLRIDTSRTFPCARRRGYPRGAARSTRGGRASPRRGVWAPSYWRWNGHRYTWIDGRWLRERRGHAQVEDRWEDRGGDWVYVRGLGAPLTTMPRYGRGQFAGSRLIASPVLHEGAVPPSPASGTASSARSASADSSYV